MSLPAEEQNQMGLHLKLLGTPQIWLDGRLLTELKSVKAQALLFYLAVSSRVHNRSVLAGLLWGDLPETAARANLSKTLGMLRNHFGKIISVERSNITLCRRESCWVDAIESDKLFRNFTQGKNIDNIQGVIDLYQGDFLEDFYVRKAIDFENWCLLERARLREQYLKSLQILADHSAESGKLEDAIALTRRYLNLEPWHEGAHRRLMLLLAQSGQRSAALMQYETCRQSLAVEFDTIPSEGTTELFKRIQAEDLGIFSTPADYTASTRPTRPAYLEEEARAAEIIEEPFVGREAQLTRLNIYLEAALEGQGQVAFISGEAGWGKTSLLNEFSRLARKKHPDLIVASGICTITTGIGDPYQPFREIMRMLTGDVEGLWAAGAISTNQAVGLWRLLPQTTSALVTHGADLINTFTAGSALLNRLELHDNCDLELKDSLHKITSRMQEGVQDSGLDQERIFEEFTDVLESISREQPLLLILDDLHWADSSSLGLLFHLSRKIDKSRILILGAYRPEEVIISPETLEHPFAVILSEIKRSRGDVWVELGPDNPADSRAFVEAIIDQEPNLLGDDFRHKLTQNTGGHPLFTVETLRDMQERGHLRQDQDGKWIESPTITWEGLPGRVEGVIEKRVNHLAPMLRSALVAASVEGEEFTAEVVAHIQGREEKVVVSMLSGDLAKKHRLVRAIGVGQAANSRISRYRFSHHLFQKYLYDSIDPVERTYLHEAVGKALESFYEDQTEQIAVQLAWHFQEAGDLEKAIAFLIQSGDSAARVHANVEASGHYRTAIDLGTQIELRGEILTRLYTNLGRVFELDSQFDQALKTYQEMMTLASKNGDLAMELAALIAQVTILAVPTTVHDPIRARRLGTQARTLAKSLGDQRAEAKILWSVSLASFFSGRLSEAIMSGERSLDLARQLDLREQMAHTLNDLGGFIYLYSGSLEKAKAASKEARKLWRELDNTPMIADSLGGSCVAHVYSGEFDQAILYSNQVFQISQEINNIWGQSYSLWAIGEVYMARGEYSQAIDVMEECIRMGEMASFIPPQTYTRSYLAKAYADIGLLDLALEIVQLGLEISQSKLRSHAPQLLGIQARLQIKNGDLRAAKTTIRLGENEDSRHSWKVLYLPILFADVELACHIGEHQKALETAVALIEQLKQFGMRSRLPEALYLKGKVLLGMKQEDAARKCFLESRTIAEELGERRILWRVFYALSRLESDNAKAETYQQEARRVIDFIVSHIEQEDFKKSFLNQPEISSILAFNNQ
jgi:adenylate cyclase